MNPCFHSIGSNPAGPAEDFSVGTGAHAESAFTALSYFPSTPSSVPAVRAGFMNFDFASISYNPFTALFGAESQMQAGPVFPAVSHMQNFPQAGIIPGNPNVHPIVPVSPAEFAGPAPQKLGIQQVPVTYSQTTATQEVPSASDAGPRKLPPKHIVEWYLLCWNAVIVNGSRRFVPQIIYQPYSQGDKERYVALATLRKPIIFRAADSQEWGIPLQNLLSRQPPRLLEGHEPASVSHGPSISIRLQWPGYPPCHKHISTRDYTSARHFITKTKLAKLVAKCIKFFMQSMNQRPMEVGSDRKWRVGPLDIKVEDLILVSLHHVSQGSWQPQLRLLC
ncbi:hypothetical protein BS17DRAFT_150953 [Gyrodon lividus]|nr:hypothetical protein BS17DRAFT_150953 [Gyrodon lividus]